MPFVPTRSFGRPIMALLLFTGVFTTGLLTTPRRLVAQPSAENDDALPHRHSVSSAAAIAHSQTCDATFTRKGNVMTGLKFTAMSSVADLSTPDAIKQLRAIVIARGYDVLATEPEAGDLLLEMPQSASQRSFGIVAKATSEGAVTTVQMQASLRRGASADTDVVKTELCGMLTELKGGDAGRAAANAEPSSASNAPTVLNAQILADRLSSERDKNVNEIPLRYKDRTFTLDGVVASVIRDGESYSVIFDITPWEKKAVRLPGESRTKTDIVCLLASGQSVFALTLKPRSKVTLTGTFREYRQFPSTMWLSECKAVK
jgi:hypothetical protein